MTNKDDAMHSSRWTGLTLLFLAVLVRDVSSQEPSPADAIAALERHCQLAIKKAENSVVSIARVNKELDALGFSTPNLGRLALNARLEEQFPTDADYIPVDYGAGVVIDASGLILTTYHVLGNIAESDYFVWFQNRPFKATVVAAEGWFDLAVLKIEATGLVPIPFHHGAFPPKGTFLIALGNPQAIARDGNVSATWAMLGNTQRRAPPAPERPNARTGRDTLHHYGTLMQIDRSLGIGYSGGALVDFSGNMVGLITAYSGHPNSPRAASFAIPVDEPFRRAVDQLKTGKAPEFGFLGIGLMPLDARVRRQGMHGTLVESVMAGTPASRAEIRVGDVVTHLDGQPIFDDDDLIRDVSRLQPETTVKLSLLRGWKPEAPGEKLEATAVLTKRNGWNIRPAVETVPPVTWRGMEVEDATAAPRDALLTVALPPEGGAYIAAVAEDSAAWKAGLRPGLFVTAVGEMTVGTANDFFSAVETVSGAVPLRILTVQGQSRVETVSP